MILSGAHDFNNLEAGFPTRTASGMTFYERNQTQDGSAVSNEVTNRTLQKIRQRMQNDPCLALFEIRPQGAEIHLAGRQGAFARLMPASAANHWRMAYVFNRDRWRYIDFSGTLEECLELLRDCPHYLFWEG
jgi:hypothetical protein